MASRRKYMIDDRMWHMMQKRLGYTDEEFKLFRTNKRNEHVISKAEQLLQTRFIVEVIESQGCNSRHKVGDRFYLDGHGNITKSDNPDKICIFALRALSGLVFASLELIYAGIDPNEMCFRSVGCLDVGIKCDGWGKIIMRLSSEKHETTQAR